MASFNALRNKIPPTPNRNGLVGAAVALFGIGSAGVLAYNGAFSVEGGHRAVMFNRFGGLGDKIYTEGLHFKLPWFQWPIVFDCRTKPQKFASATGTKDLQTVDIKLRVLFRPRQDRLQDLYRFLGKDYAERVLPSIVNETLKAAVAQFNAAELITQREAVSAQIRKMLTERASAFLIEVEDVSITDLTFGTEYSAAIEAKQVAQQDAERAKFVVEKAAQDAKSVVIRAQGEAESAVLIGNALAKNPGFLELRRLETARQISHLMSNSQNKLYLDADTLMLNIANTSDSVSRLKPESK